jgi:hypothetical protein
MSGSGSDYRSHAWLELTERWGRAKKDGKWKMLDDGSIVLRHPKPGSEKHILKPHPRVIPSR